MTRMTKTFPAKAKTIDREKGIFEVWISTEDVDRQGDIVRATGAKLDNFKKNPVVLWGHDYNTPPIAKALSIETIPGVGLKSQFKFPSPGISAMADTIRGLWSEGFINAASIGFNPLKSISLDPSRPYGPQEYTEYELLEYSLVAVPAQANAVALSMANRKNGQTDPAIKALESGLQAVKQARYGSNTQYLTAISRFIDLVGAALGVKSKSR